MGSKRRFCSAVLCVPAKGGYAFPTFGSSTSFHRARVAMSARGASPALGAAVAAPVPGTVLKLQRREIEVNPDMELMFCVFHF